MKYLQDISVHWTNPGRETGLNMVNEMPLLLTVKIWRIKALVTWGKMTSTSSKTRKLEQNAYRKKDVIWTKFMSCWSKVRSQNENVEGGRDLNEQPKLDNSHQMFNKSDVVVVALSAFFLSFGQLLAGCYCYLLLYLAYTRELMQETKVEREQSTDIVALDPAASVLEFLWLSLQQKNVIGFGQRGAQSRTEACLIYWLSALSQYWRTKAKLYRIYYFHNFHFPGNFNATDAQSFTWNTQMCFNTKKVSDSKNQVSRA